MKLIICEKPSLAKNVKDAVSKRETVAVYVGKFTKSGFKSELVNFSEKSKEQKAIFYRSKNYIITYCFGHLFSCGEPEKYLPEGMTGWDLSSLPILPDHFRLFPIDDRCRMQYMLIAALMQLPEVTAILNCGDADREGEIIVRNVLRISKNKKPVMRLWLPEQTEESILFSLDNLVPDSEYDNLANSGYARTFVDWLFGYNLSRYLMLKIGQNKGWGVGRVIIPIVDAVFQREIEIRNFVSSPYFQIKGFFEKDGHKIELQDKPKFDKRSDAAARADLLNTSLFTVVKTETKKAVVSPPRLFSLDTLQGELSKDFGMTLEQSMPLIQSLYENKYITYPRTDTEYFSENEKANVYAVIDKLNSEKGFDLEHKDSKKIFDSTKIVSHSAIRPTTILPTSLSDDLQRVYDTVLNRFCAVFAPPCEVNRTIVTISNEENVYTLKGDVPLTNGFRRYEPKKQENNDENSTLPVFYEGEKIGVQWSVEEKQTKAPPRYTVDSLNAYLKEPFKNSSERNEKDSNEVSDDTELYENIKKGMEIGTVATRTAIITKAVKDYKYLALKGGKYYCTEKGEAFINYLSDLKIDLFRDKNVEFNVMIKNVEIGKLTIQQAIDITAEEIRNIILTDVQVQAAENFNSESEIGKCPFCGKEISDGKSNFYCSGYKEGCQFKIWKKNNCKFSFQKGSETVNYIKQISITKANAKALLKSKQTTVLVEEKNGKGKYKITVEFKPDGRNDFVSLGRILPKK